MNIIVLGHNHSTAPVELREKVSFTPDSIRAALKTLTGLNLIKETVIISTCNRNEIYCVVPDYQSAKDALIEFLYSFHRIKPGDLDGTLYSYSDTDAVEHLFAVASGVDSLIAGETQVFSQVKEAFKIAFTMKSTGLIFNKLFHRCFETSKMVRQMTKISHGAVSVSFAASELARKIFSSLENKTMLLIGAGKTSELTAKNLSKHGANSFIVANRTYDRAVKLAERLGGQPVPLDELNSALEEADILISSTSSSDYIIKMEALANLMHKRKNSPLFIIDLAVPRDIHPDAGKLYNVFLYDIDDLSAIANENKRKREKEIEKSSEIIAKSVAAFMSWYQSLEVTPTIISLREHFEAIRQGELDRYTKNLPPEARDLLDAATRAMINKLLHSPSMEIKKSVENGGGYILTQSIRKLFRLRDEND